jgi:puromycin-sensitive aminopeptidase
MKKRPDYPIGYPVSVIPTSQVIDMRICHLVRLNILDDLFSLISAGKAPTVEGLKLLDAFVNETNYVVWNKINDTLAILNSLLANEDFLPELHRFVRQLLSGIRRQITWDPVEGESHFDTLLRSLVISRLGRAGDQEVRAEAKRRFDLHASGEELLNADIR